MTTLFPCPTCQRHVRPGDLCPFCGATLGPPPAGSIEPKRGVRRAVMFAATAALTAGATIDCGGDVETQSTSSNTTTSAGGNGGDGGTSATGTTTSDSTTATATTTTSAGGAGGEGGTTTSSGGNGAGVILPPYGAPPF